MLKVPYGQDPYSVIGKYIQDHITAIEDIIAVIEIDDITTNQLFMVDMNEENYFIWNNDWYEGEKDVALIDFFPVSEAINPSAQPSVSDCWGCNCPKMERLKEQKTFSEMVHLHDDETHDKRTETHGVCLDTISRQDAIDACLKGKTDGLPATNVACDCCAERIRVLPSAQPEQQWIPCSEPPKESGTYIVTAYDGTDKRVTFVKYQKTLKRWELTGARSYWRILAYKPLPEPWKGEINGDTEK